VTHFRHLFITGTVSLIVVIGLLAGWLTPVDDALRDLRFEQAQRAASGDLVFVQANALSASNLVANSRARSDYAEAIDVLLDLGASKVVLAVNLSSMLGLMDDLALGEALRSAGGKILTTAYQLGGTQEGGTYVLKGLLQPHERFITVTPPVFADNFPDADGKLRRYRAAVVYDGWVLETMATALVPQGAARGSAFLIDYGIDLDTVPRIGLEDLLSGDVAPAMIAGKQIIIGVDQHAPGDMALAPRYGLIDIVSVQLLAVETLLQQRNLVDAGHWPTILMVMGVALTFWVLRRRLALRSAVLGAMAYSLLLETLALALHLHSGLLLNTAGVHLAQLGFVFAAFLHELDLKARSLSATSLERDSMRGILARVVADNFDGVVVVDKSQIIRAASRLAEDIVGTDLRGRLMHDVLPQAFQDVLAAALDDGVVVDTTTGTTITGGDGSERIIEYVVTLSSLEDGEVSPESAGRVACLTFRDVTERRQVERRLVFLAEHDTLTGAVSRPRFLKIVESNLPTPDARATGLRVMIVGLTRLKTVNDTLGHDFGDMLLRQAVKRLTSLDVICIGRLETNSFGILVPGRLDDNDAQAFAEKVLATITAPYDLDGHHAIVGANLGMTDTGLSLFDPETLVAHATMALSRASDLPGNAIAVFDEEMNQRIKSKQEMEVALRRALDSDEFSVHYQPQVALDSGEVIGVEALIRWTHPEMGNIPPGQFIPTAEETGLIIELGRWVLRRACMEVAGWPKPVQLSVNVSPLQFEHGDIVADVREALEKSGLPAERLVVEITESLLITETSQFTAKLEELRACGIGVALDDFGTGYSSLSYLGRLPIDKIKIDQSFVSGLPDNAASTAIIRAVLMLADSLDKSVIAEGIETVDQAWLLRLLGCRIGQGYYFGRPCPAVDLVAKLNEDEADKMPMEAMG